MSSQYFGIKTNKGTAGQSKKRPRFGKDQVRTLTGLKPGRLYFSINISNNETHGCIIKVLDFIPNKDHFLRVDTYLLSGKKHTNNISLRDRSVIPYRNEDNQTRWNTANFILRTRAKTIKGARRSLKIKLTKIKEERKK